MFTEIENILGSDLDIVFEYMIHPYNENYCTGFVDLAINYVLDNQDQTIRVSAFTDYDISFDDLVINSLHEYIDLSSLEFIERESYYTDLPSSVDIEYLYSIMFDLIKEHCTNPPTNLGYVRASYKLI